MSAIAAAFTNAIANAPCIFFIDELDSIPKRRSSERDENYYNQVTNCVLKEFDRLTEVDVGFWDFGLGLVQPHSASDVNSPIKCRPIRTSHRSAAVLNDGRVETSAAIGAYLIELPTANLVHPNR